MVSHKEGGLLMNMDFVYAALWHSTLLMISIIMLLRFINSADHVIDDPE